MKRRMLVVLMLAALGVSCKNSPTTPTPIPAGPTTVLMANSTAFTPATLTISTGTTVTWGNNDSTNHTSTADGGQWDSSSLGQGQIFTHRFDTTGSFKYHCTFHANMTGTIVVQ